MFAHTAAVVTSLLSLSIAACALPSPQGAIAPVCSTGTVSCCNQVQQGSSPLVQELASLLQLAVPVNANVGVDCSPISVVGVLNQNSCKSQAACCPNNAAGSLVAVGCVPLNVL